jgi:hypothetical protein
MELNNPQRASRTDRVACQNAFIPPRATLDDFVRYENYAQDFYATRLTELMELGQKSMT